MSQWRAVRNARSKALALARAKLCHSGLDSLRGLLFTRSLPGDQGIIIPRRHPSRLWASVHTLGMSRSIAIVWLDADGVVVDARRAQPGRLAIVPRKPAQTVIEGHPSLLGRIAIGDQLAFDEAAS